MSVYPVQSISPSTNQYLVVALYQFVVVDAPSAWQVKLQEICDHYHLLGTLLVASEGLNGTLAGGDQDVRGFTDWLMTKTIFNAPEIKFSYHTSAPFHRMKVRLKREIVTMGRDDIRPVEQAGTYVEPKDWNRLITDPAVMVVDTRNDYEVAIGQFQGAENPQTATFRDFPKWAETLAHQDADKRPKKLAMYCTGGIRCEKSTALMKQLGFDEVYHLKGGILQYLEDIPQEQSLWQGECFVFDERVAVDHDLAKGRYEMCHACKMPLDKEDMASQHYKPGIACPHCFDKTTPERRARFAERMRQITLAQERGVKHIGQRQKKDK